MLVYEKGIGVDRHLYGTLGAAPSADDTQLTYVDDDEQTIEVSFDDVLFNDGHGGMLNKDGDHVNVKIDDTYIIPAGEE